MDKKTIIISLLKEIDTDVLIGIWNTYCSDENMDDYIYENDDYNINEIFTKPDEALRAAFYGDYRYNHDYFVLNGYGNLESFDEYDAYNHIDIDILADYIMENGCDELSENYSEELQDEFLNYINEKFEDREFTEDDIPGGTDLITEDWDEILSEILDED